MTDKTAEELQKELDEERAKAKALASKNERLEEESKKHKSRAQLAEEKNEEAEKKKLEENGELEKLLGLEREKNSKLTSTLETRTQGVLREKLKAEVATYAKDAHDVDMILKVTECKDLLSVNEDDLSVSGAEDFVKKVREIKPFMFRKKKIDDTEENKGGKEEPKTTNEEYLKELDACTTREELDKIKKKYGRSD